ncbi:MAG: binding-protein-dependent transport system inner rane component [Rhodospirillales bacterium]|nr:binding-protein-dependent transport system inner rane component [Rhodospirillales bacterium]
MSRFLLQRLLSTVPVMAIVATIVFLLLRFSAGDPAAILAGDAATPATIAAIRARLGLDQPMAVQLVRWFWQLLHGDLGTSIISNQGVAHLIADRMAPTLALSATTILFAIVVAVPLGVVAAWKHGTIIDRAVMTLSVVGFSMPVFVLGYLWILGFAIRLRWLPVQGFSPLSDGIGPFLAHLVLPTLTLSVIYIALIARITRASVLEVLGEDYIRTARAKGVPERAVLMRHALGNAAVPIVSVIGIGVALLIGGVVVTESVFNLPGLGRLTVDAVLARDYPVIQGIILVFSGVYVLVNLAVDLAYVLLDPRIRY